MLDKKHDYGIATGLNVSTMDYQSCSVESLRYWAEDMNWTEASYFFSYSKPVMFKLNNMWHLSWVSDVFVELSFTEISTTNSEACMFVILLQKCFLVCPPSGNMARKQCFLVCPPSGNMAGKQ